jgi:hypothetical protein
MATKEELQKILDGILPQLNKFGRAKKANELLSDVEKDELYDVVASNEEQKKERKKKSKKKQDEKKNVWYLNSINRVVSIIKKHPEFVYYDKGYNEDETPLVSMEMPFLIKQILFYIYCEAKSNNEDLRLNGFLGDLQSAGLYKTKKLLNVGGMTPDGYLDMVRYTQPKNPCLYKGQKKEELAYAIKNLAYQAGSYSYYVDVFGGSGAATTALYPQDRVKQVYNEINLAVYNLFDVLTSDDYEELKHAINILKQDLQNYEYSFDSYYDVKHILKNYGFSTMNEKEQKVLKKWDLDFVFDKNSVNKCLKSLPNTLFDQLPANCKVDGYDIPTMKNWKTYQEFIAHYKTIEKAEAILDSQKAYFNNNRVSRVNGSAIDATGTIIFKDIFYGWHKKNIIQVKALIYYCYFKEIRFDNTVSKVKRAAGEIFLHNLSTLGDIISSSILGYDRSELENKRNELNKFLKDDFDSLINAFHNRVKRCADKGLLRHVDFRKVFDEFKKIKGSKLFYVDSPYDSTSDYNEEDGNVDEFTPKDMKALINILSESKDRFIFSMRAVGTSRRNEVRKKANASIKDNVYEVFKECKIKNLYVVVILSKKYTVEHIIQNGVSQCEIMLTNFQVSEFAEYPLEKKSKKFQFKIYKFADFMKLIDENMPVLRKPDECV